MLKIKSLTVKNFMSVGNVTQSISFNNNDLALVLGENLDLGGNDNRNGVGKTTIVNSLSYALFGSALTNIKKNNLINKTNKKHMLVTLDFDIDGTSYRVERGRSPNIFKFIVNNTEFLTEDLNEAQGENRVTQQELERVLGISHNMFKNIIALNTFSEPFLSMRANDQREMIEQLLGITKLSEKAEILKSLLKGTKDSIKEEEFKIKAIQEANSRIEDNIKSLKTRSKAWEKAHSKTIKDTEDAIEVLQNIDIDKEIELHKQHAAYKTFSNKHKEYTKEIKGFDREISLLQKSLDNANEKLSSVCDTSTCPTCGSEMEDEKHDEIIAKFTKEKGVAEEKLEKVHEKSASANDKLSALEVVEEPSETFYADADQAYEHKSSIASLENQLSQESERSNPYIEQIDSLTNEGLQEIDFDHMNNLVELREHQEFLLKLLTNKDSFIRKKIINQNLNYLNARLAYYLNKIGLPHKVVFMSDLSVEITEHGRDLDFDNLSRGERTRLILSLSWAFRDVYESLNHKINLLFIDELIDGGLDTSGVENALTALKKMTREQNRSIMLISHRDELVGRVDTVIRVVKEGGFTTFDSEADTQLQ